MKGTMARKSYMVLSTIFLIVLCALMIAPIVQVVASSLSDKSFVQSNSVFLFPRGFTIDAYTMLFEENGIFRVFFNSVIVTVSATVLGLILTSMLAYPLSRDEYKGKEIVTVMIIFTMIFSAPLIPQYLLIKDLGMDNSLLSVIIPFAMSPFYLIIMRTFFKGISRDLIDSARIDGASEMRILLSIIVPLSKASYASIAMFYAVGHWNSLRFPLIFLRDRKLQTLQIKLYDIVMQGNIEMEDLATHSFSGETVKMSTIVFATVPILIIYPFLQKYFIEGATLGSLKG